MQQLENISVIPKVKKEIAQIKTLLNEYKNGTRKIEGQS